MLEDCDWLCLAYTALKHMCDDAVCVATVLVDALVC